MVFPITEIDFCGHATLATAFVLFEENNLLNEVTFYCKSCWKFKSYKT